MERLDTCDGEFCIIRKRVKSVVTLTHAGTGILISPFSPGLGIEADLTLLTVGACCVVLTHAAGVHLHKKNWLFVPFFLNKDVKSYKLRTYLSII